VALCVCWYQLRKTTAGVSGKKEVAARDAKPVGRASGIRSTAVGEVQILQAHVTSLSAHPLRRCSEPGVVYLRTPACCRTGSGSGTPGHAGNA
jgi:hypothetical protein